MLAKFTVTNFKSFNKPFQFDLEEINKYEFNKENIENGVVKNSLVYGHNGVGKSNLGLAIFDIIDHLTDYEKNENLYSNYLNANNVGGNATFNYEFKFDDDYVFYNYKKDSDRTIVEEELIINDKVVAKINRELSEEAIVKLEGAEGLNKILTNKNLSLLKYIKHNTQLTSSKENNIISSFFEFVDGMLFFRSLNANEFIGIENGGSNIMTDIINNDNVENFESFLNDAGIQCKLSYKNENEHKVIFFDFKDRSIPFFEAASTGTRSLTLFYFWLQRIKIEKKTKFVFIDEFDAFYHHKLSESIIKELVSSDIQFVLTTHNTTNISNDILRPDCYFLMYMDQMKSLSNRTQKELREAHNIEKMYKAGAFNEL